MTPEQANFLEHLSSGVIVFEHSNNSQSGNATGTIISNDLVLTCAHAIYNPIKKTYYKNLRFYPGANGLVDNKDCYEV
jgi:V8-like Glu-specific endopeptidase